MAWNVNQFGAVVVAVGPATQVISGGLVIGLELALLDGMGSEIVDNQASPSADNALIIAGQAGMSTVSGKP